MSKKNDKDRIVLQETFEGLRPGPVAPKIFGPHMEMHAQPASPEDNLDGWNNRSGGYGLPLFPWSMVQAGRKRYLESSASATCADNTVIAKGDICWKNYTAETNAILLPVGKGWGGPAGLVFRFQDSQHYYAAVVDADGYAKLLLRHEEGFDALAWAPLEMPCGKEFSISVKVKGSRIRASIGPVELKVKDPHYDTGCVGFIGSRPVRFGELTVRAKNSECKRIGKVHTREEKRLTRKRRKYGRPVLWKKFDTPGFGCGRRIRLGDLTGDGSLDFLLVQLGGQHKHGLGCLTAMDSEGTVLWQLGEPKAPPEKETSGSGPVQIHDIDGDGRNEVVVAWEGEFRVMDGQSGQVKYTAPLPGIQPLPKEFKGSIQHWGGGYNDEGPFMNPSEICFADLAGRGKPRDVLLADNYHTLVAMDPEFREQWRTVCSHGHYPQAYDFDGNGRESVLAGYQHISPDGELLGRVCLQDHQDAIYAGPLDAHGQGPAKILMAGGEDGLLLLTPGYDIRQRVMGHVQRLAIGRFREDVPGLCVATVLFHGNPGIVSMFDSSLRKLWTRDFPVVGSTLQPVNWDGSGVELMFYSGVRPSQGHAGGLIDGEGDLVVPMPDDGGPGMCALAYDFDGDGLDELMVWDHYRICLYHTDQDAPTGPAYRPMRPPLYNMSNFQSYWSRPHWDT